MKAQPMAASAMAARMPPCTVPMGLPWASVASRTTTASPGEKDSSRMPRSVAAGGGGASPRTMRSMPSSSFAIAPAPRLGCPGRSLPPGIVLGPGPVVYAAKAQRPSLPSILVRHHALDRGGLVMTRWALVAAVLSALVVAALPSSGHAQGKDTLVVALVARAPTLDPHMHFERVGILVNVNMFDSLLHRNTKLEFEPSLATSWKAVSDTEWEFKIRKGVRFHNGDIMNAEDVKYSFDRVLDPKKKSPQYGNIRAIKDVRVVDPETIVITTDKPFPLLTRAPHLLLHRAQEARGSGGRP